MQTNVHNVSVPMIQIFLSLSDVCLALVVHTDRVGSGKCVLGEVNSRSLFMPNYCTLMM